MAKVVFKLTVLGYAEEHRIEFSSKTTVAELENAVLDRLWKPYMPDSAEPEPFLTTILLPLATTPIRVTPENRTELRSRSLEDLGLPNVLQIDAEHPEEKIMGIVCLNPPRTLAARARKPPASVEEDDKRLVSMDEAADPPNMHLLTPSWEPYQKFGLSVTGPFISQWTKHSRSESKSGVEAESAALAFELIEMYAEFALQEPELLTLSRSELNQILGSNHLRVSTQVTEITHATYVEALVFDAVVRWLTANKQGSQEAMHHEFMSSDSLFHRVRFVLTGGARALPMLTQAVTKVLALAPAPYQQDFLKTLESLNSYCYDPLNGCPDTDDGAKKCVFDAPGAFGSKGIPGILALFDYEPRYARYPPHIDILTPILTSPKDNCTSPMSILRQNVDGTAGVHFARQTKLASNPTTVAGGVVVPAEKFHEFKLILEQTSTGTMSSNMRIGYIDSRCMHRHSSRGFYFQQDATNAVASNYSEGQITYTHSELGLVPPKTVYNVRMGLDTYRWWIKREHPAHSESTWRYISQLRTSLANDYRFGLELPKNTKLTVEFPEWPTWMNDTRSPRVLTKILFEF